MRYVGMPICEIVALKDAVLLRQLAPVLVKGREQALFVHTAG